jgi:hypothetical protein
VWSSISVAQKYFEVNRRHLVKFHCIQNASSEVNGVHSALEVIFSYKNDILEASWRSKTLALPWHNWPVLRGAGRKRSIYSQAALGLLSLYEHLGRLKYA